MKKIAIIGTNGLPGNYGGWDQLVKHLTNNLKNQFSFHVYTSSYNAIPGVKDFNGARLVIVKLKANGFQSVPYDIFSLLHASLYCDILFICGTSGCISLPFIRLFGKKIILNPDGLEWKRKKWSFLVKWFLKLFEKVGVKFSDIIVSDNVEVKKYILHEYKKESQLIEYGGDHVLNIDLSNETGKKFGIDRLKYAFKVCRIEPENNIHLILESFKENGNINLVIVGNWNFSKYGRDLRKNFEKCRNIILLDPIYEQNSLNELRSNCSLYIHGHSVGGTNPSLVEAMHLGLCVIAYKVSYNVETTEGKALYFENKSDLLKILNSYENNNINIREYQMAMKGIAQRRYKWDIITEKYAKVFKEILS